MGKISKCYYHPLDEKDCSVEQAAEFYFHQNMMTADVNHMKAYEEYDYLQTKKKDTVLGHNLRIDNLLNQVNAGSATLAISTMHNKVVIYANA